MPKRKQATAEKEAPPIYDIGDAPCKLCRKHKDGICDECGGPIAGKSHDVNMGASGYQSIAPSHFHLKTIEGVQGKSSYFAELCLKCHKADRVAMYGK